MYTYTIHFRGRKVNALGVMDVFNIKVVADSIEKAILSLYDRYEHISVISIDNPALIAPFYG